MCIFPFNVFVKTHQNCLWNEKEREGERESGGDEYFPAKEIAAIVNKIKQSKLRNASQFIRFDCISFYFVFLFVFRSFLFAAAFPL